MLGEISFTKRCVVSFLAALTALQPLTSYAQSIGEAIRNADKPLPHVLPIADRVDMLPLPYVPPQWSSRAAASAPEALKVANAISMSMSVDKTAASVGDTVTWTLTADNLTASASGALTATDTLPANITTISVFPGSGVTCGAASAGTAFTCSIPSMAANTSNRAVVTVSAQMLAEGSLTNMATLKNASNAMLNCNGAVADCSVTTQVTDDDDITPLLIAALRPQCGNLIASPSAVGPGASFSLAVTCTFKGNLFKDYVWAGAGVPNPTLTTTPSYTVANAPTTPGSYVYSVIANNGNVPSSVKNVTLTVLTNPPPTVTISSPSTSISVPDQTGYSITASATDSDPGVYSIQLFDNNNALGALCTFPVVVNAQRTCTANLPPSAALGVHSIKAVATDGVGGSATSNAVNITVTPVAPSGCTISGPPSLPTQSSASGTYSVACAGGSPLAGYSWSRTPTGPTATTPTITDAPFTGSTPVNVTYTVVVSNAAGNATANLTVINSASNTAPQLSIKGAGIVGNQVVVAVTATDIQSSALTYAGSLSNGTVLTYSDGQLTGAAPTVPGIYTITVTASDGSATTSATSTIAVQTATAAEDVGAGSNTNTAVGITGGSFGVTESGAATYSIPIQVPPGTNGLQPNLALAYSSQGGYGILGVGWNLSGLGAITRCPKTLAQDQYREPINYDNKASNDEYCYGGQRLIPVGPLTSAGQINYVVNGNASTYTAMRREFRTEIDSYSRITGFMEFQMSVPDGYARFEVETKSGQVLHFSNRFKPLSNGFELCPAPAIASNCQRQNPGKSVKFFVVDRIEDRSGNRIDIEYAGTNVVDFSPYTKQPLTPASFAAPSYPPTEIYPTQIHYAGNPSQGAAFRAKVTFEYETIPEAGQVRAFDAGAGETITTKQLIGIRTYENDTLNKRYRLEYVPGGSGSTGRMLLGSVQECFDSVPGSCLAATQLSWNNGFFTGFDGTNSGIYARNLPTIQGDYSFSAAKVADIFGNGRTAWLNTEFTGYQVGSSGAGKISVCSLNASGAMSCSIQYFLDQTGNQNNGKNVFWADVDGDGRADLIVQLTRSAGSADGRVFVCLSNKNGTGFGATPQLATPCTVSNLGWSGNDDPVLQGDFNGDGRIDFAVYRGPANSTDIYSPQRFQVFLADGNGYFINQGHVSIFPWSVADVAAGRIVNKDQFVVADFNGDGLADILQIVGSGKVRACFSRITSTYPYSWTMECPQDKDVPMPGTSSPPRLPDPWAEFTCKIDTGALPAGGSKTFSMTGTLAAGGPFYYTAVLSTTSNPDDNCFAYSEYSVGTNQAPIDSLPDVAGQKRTGSGPGCVDASGSVFSPQLDLSVSKSNAFPVAGSGNTFWVTVQNQGTGTFPEELTLNQRSPQGFTPSSVSVPSGMSCAKKEATPATAATGPYGYATATQDLLLVDINGDGLADMLSPVDSAVEANGQWNVCLSTGDGAFARYRTTGQVQSTCSVHTLVKAKAENVLLGDFNGDGRTDLLAWVSGTAWNACFSRGTDATSTSATASVGFDCRPFTWYEPLFKSVRGGHIKAGDFNGDGFTDVSFSPADGSIRIGSATGASYGVKQDLISAFTTGLGAATSVTYAPLTVAAVYDVGSAAGQLPPGEVHIQSPMRVVSGVVADNGLGGSFATSYEYKGLKGTTTGRGMLGFSQRIAKDLTGNFTTTTTYNNSLNQWQLAGRPISSIKTHPNALSSGNKLNQTDTTYHVNTKVVGSATVYQVFPNTVNAYTWDLNGTALPTSTTTTVLTDYDAYGHVKKSTVSTSDGFTKVTENTYLNQVTAAPYGSLARGDWIVGRVQAAKATHQKSGYPDVVRNSSFTYYGIDAGCSGATRGFLCEETLESALENNGAQQVAGRNDLPNYLLWQKTKYAYDAFGNRTSATISYKDAANAMQSRFSGSSSFDGYGRFATTVANALGHSETRTFDGSFGNVRTTVGPNGYLTESTYDQFGRKLRERSFDGSSNNTQVVSDASWLHQACTESDPLYAGAATCNSVAGERYRTRKRVSAGPTSIVFYDKLQREVRAITQAFNDGNWAESTVTYDAKGRKASTTRPAGAGTVTTNYGYDDLNRVTTETLTGGALIHITRTEYNGLNTTVTQQAGAVANPTLDQSLTKVSNSQGQVVSSTDALINDTSFTYDAVGNLSQVSAAGSVTETMGYDLRGRKISLSSPTAGTYHYTPNGLGELVKQKDGRGYESVMFYDPLGRLSERREFESAASSTTTSATGTNPFTTVWSYDGPCGANGPNGNPATKGKLCNVATTKNGQPHTQSSTNYDPLGRAVMSVTELDRSTTATADGKHGPRTFISTVQFDANSRAERMGSPGGVIQKNVYKTWGGGLQSVTDNAGTTTHWSASERYSDGQLQTMSVGGRTTGKAYDALGRIDTIITGGGSIQSLDINFDRFGNLTQRVDTVNGVNTETYGYDKLNRLSYRGLNGAALSTTPFATYDAIGNLMSLTVSGWGGSGTGTSSYSYDTGSCKRLITVTGAQPRNMGDCTTGYDAVGNLTNDGVRTMQYTAWNLPKLITKTSGTNTGSTLAYEYDASHARIKEVSTQHGTTYYAGGYELVIPVSSTANQNQTEERTYLSSPEGTIGVITQKSTANASGAATQSTDTAYWHKDHLGSLVAITNPSGTVTQRFRFDAWGNRDCLLPSGGTTPCSSTNTGGANGTGSEERGFTGHEMLDEVGLIHMNGRLFDPAIGRFTQADPIIQEPLNSQNYNRYSYVLNNPLVYTDPSGYSFWTKVRKPLAAVAIMIITQGMGSGFVEAAGETAFNAAVAEGQAAAIGAAEVATASAQMLVNAVGGFAAGGITGGNIESAVMGAFQAAASFGIGEATGHGTLPFGSTQYFQNVIAHAALGCGMSAMAGGTCKSGALASGFSAAAGPVISGLTEGNFGAGLAGRMAAGCVGSYIGKGSCEAGAVTAAFDYLYNACGGSGECSSKGESVAHALWPGYDLGTCMSNSGAAGACSGVEWGLGVIGVIPGAGPLAKAFKVEKALKTTYVVYEGIDLSTGVVKYVGITSRDVLVRAAEHAKALGGKELLDYRVVEGAANLTKQEARIFEQNLINKYGGVNGGQLLNKINSIAEKYWTQYGIKK